MPKIEVFDPAMCCSTGVCGPSVDPVLPRFAADLDWVKGQGVTVERYNLSQQPAAFASNATVKAALAEQGPECLPLILVDGFVASRKFYPERAQLAQLVGLPATTPAAAPAKACCGPKKDGSSEKCC